MVCECQGKCKSVIMDTVEGSSQAIKQSKIKEHNDDTKEDYEANRPKVGEELTYEFSIKRQLETGIGSSSAFSNISLAKETTRKK